MRRSLKSWETGVILGASAFLIRFLGIVVGGFGSGAHSRSDASAHDEFARIMMNGWQWISKPIAAQEPLYPAFMAFSYVLPGPESAVLKLLQCLLGGITVFSIYLVIRMVTRESIAVTASLLVALNPHFIMYSAQPYHENLVIPLLASFLVLFLLGTDKSSKRILAIAALAYALLIHTDVRFLPLVMVFPLMLFSLTRRVGESVRLTGCLWLLLLVFMLPYQVRGYAVFRKPVIVVEHLHDKLAPMSEKRLSWEEEGVFFNGRHLWLLDWNTQKQKSLEDLTAFEKKWYETGIRPQIETTAIYSFLLKEYWRFIRVRPEYRPYPDGRFTGVWSLRHNLINSLILLPFFLLFPWVWLGTPSRERRFAIFLLIFLIAHMFLHMADHTLERLRIPIEVILAVLLAIACVNVWKWNGAKLRGRSA